MLRTTRFEGEEVGVCAEGTRRVCRWVFETHPTEVMIEGVSSRGYPAQRPSTCDSTTDQMGVEKERYARRKVKKILYKNRKEKIETNRQNTHSAATTWSTNEHTQGSTDEEGAVKTKRTKPRKGFRGWTGENNHIEASQSHVSSQIKRRITIRISPSALYANAVPAMYSS